jgi:hypothetical protein
MYGAQNIFCISMVAPKEKFGITDVGHNGFVRIERRQRPLLS